MPTAEVVWTGAGLSPQAFTTASVGTGDTPIFAVQGATMAVDDSGPTPPRIKWTTGDTGYAEWHHDPTNLASWRFYQEFTTLGTGGRIALAFTGSRAVWLLDFNGAGALQLKEEGGGLLAQSAAGLLVGGQRYRFELAYNAGAVGVDVYRFENGDPETYLATLLGVTDDVQATQLWWGATFPTGRGDAYGDSLAIAIDSPDQFGPVLPPVPPIPASSGILTAMDAVTAALAATDGLRASQDISKVNAPGVWVTLQDVRPEFMNGDGTVALYLYLIAPNVAFRDTVRLLDDLLGKVSAVVPTEGDIQPVSLVVSDGKATLPAWRVTSLATYQREA